MDPNTERLSRTLWVGVGLVIVILCVAFVLSRLTSAGLQRTPKLPVIAQVSDFILTNQSGQTITLTNLIGQIWVADIIFTRCPGPCPRMTKQMQSLQDALPFNRPVKLVTLTSNPEFDTPDVLLRYADRFGADARRWLFLTGAKSQIASLAIDGLKLTAVEKQPAQRENVDDLFIHSTAFVLVDRQARLRAVFETGGEDVDWNKTREALLQAIKQLEREP